MKKINLKKQLIAVVMGLGLPLIAWADISGTVYRDLPVNGTTLNTYGVKDANEPGVEGVTVTAYPSGNSTTTASDGTWSIAGITGDVRVEFTWSSMPWLQSSPDAGNGNTSVQFVSAPSTIVDFGLHYPSDFSDTATPLVAVPRHENGRSSGNTDPALFSLSYDQNGNFGSDDGVPDDWTGNTDATFEEVGATWGIAYQKSQQRMFLSALVKRHSGMANGLDTIYVLDYSSVPVSTINHFNLQGVSGVDLGTLDRSSASGSDYTLPSGDSSPSHDLDAFGKAGVTGFGDIDLSEDEKTLWAVNLNQKALIQINVSGSGIPAAGDVTQTLMSSLSGLPTCTGGELRPWALKFYAGKGYLGFVCDASTSQDPANLMAYVTSFDPANLAGGLTQELSFSLDYTRHTDTTRHGPRTEHKPWMFTYDNNLIFQGSYAQPVLSDIEFSPDGSMYLSFLDRWGIQFGNKNYPPISGVSWTAAAKAHGELLKVCRVNNSWVLEGGDPACPTMNETTEASGVNNNGEFFNDHGGDDSREYTLGAVAQLAGSGELIAAMNDPFPGLPAAQQYWYNNGLQWFSLTDGSHQTYVQTDTTHDATGSSGCDYENDFASSRACGFAKSSGVGDVELLTPPAPIEIGNLVWMDTDEDGVQDANEAGIAGVTIELVSGSSVIDTATTDANGNYIFSNDPNGTSTASHRYNITGLTADADYTVRIPNVDGANKQTALGTNNLTTANTGEGSAADTNDSDGSLSNDDAVASVTAADVPYSGANNHTYDFGFRNAPAACSITASAIASACTNVGNDGDGSNDTFMLNVTVEGANTGASTSYNYTSTSANISGSGTYSATAETDGAFVISTTTSPFNLIITDAADNTCTTTVSNITAPATCSTATPSCTTIVNSASITSVTETDTDTSNDSDSASIQANCDTPDPDLRLVKRADKTQVVAGETVVFTLELTNEGAGDATAIQVEDILPAGLTYVSNNPQQGSYNSGTGIWNVGDLAAGQTVTLEITVTVD